MTTRGEAAVIVLAAGAGTRMRSDTPKVLHTLAGRSMLSHALHAVAKVAPQHLVVVVGQDREPVATAVEALAEHLGRRIDITVQDEQLGTGHAVGCGLTALPDDFDGHRRGHGGRRSPARRGHPRRTRRRARRRVRRSDGADHDRPGPDRLRPHPSHSGPRGDRHRRAVRRHAVSTGHLRDQRRRLRLRQRGAALGTEPVAVRQRPTRAVPDRRHLDRPRRTATSCAPATSTTARWSRASTTGCSWPTSPPNSTAASWPSHQLAGVTVIDPATTWIDVDVTVGRDTVIRPGTQLLGATARRRAAARSGPTPR